VELPVTSVVQSDMGTTSAQLINLLRVGGLISGECSLCNEVILSKVSAEEGSASRLIKEVFAKHVLVEHFTLDSGRYS
jgi:hypothetical protein